MSSQSHESHESHEYHESDESPVYAIRPTLEQENIISAFRTHNVIVDAVAGSGKTTTILGLVSRYSHKRFLILTYNTKLRIETRQRLERLGLSNAMVHTYHSFATFAHGTTINNDKKLLESFPYVFSRIIQFDALVIDECQDMTQILYKLVCKIRKFCFTHNPQIIVLGDIRQCIFDFNDAHPFFLYHADKVFGTMFPLPWAKLTLHESFRCPPKICSIVNSFVGMNLLKPALDKPGHAEWYTMDIFETQDIFARVVNLFYKWKPNDIFVLAPSLKNNKTPARILANSLSNHKIPIYVPISDEETLQEEALANKVVFSTFHQSKGLERPVVIIFGIDALYFEFFARESDCRVCPNTFYVALTRSLHTLILIQNFNSPDCVFAPFERLSPLFDFTYREKFNPKTTLQDAPPKSFSVTGLLKFVSLQTMLECLQHLRIETRRPESHKLHRITVSEDNETVSEITGIAVTSFFEQQQMGTMSTFQECRDILNNKREFTDRKLKSVMQCSFAQTFAQRCIQNPVNSIESLLRVCTLFSALQSGYAFKLCQIKRFDWISSQFLDECHRRMQSVVHEPVRFESFVSYKTDESLFSCTLSGFIDIVSEQGLFEIKCVDQITTEHILQIVLYAFIRYMNNSQYSPNLFVYNVLTDELLQVHCTTDALKEITRLILVNKISAPKVFEEEEFFQIANWSARFIDPEYTFISPDDCIDSIEQQIESIIEHQAYDTSPR